MGSAGTGTPRRKISKPVRPSEMFKAREPAAFIPKSMFSLGDSQREQKSESAAQSVAPSSSGDGLFHALNKSFTKSVDAALQKNPCCDLSSTLFPQYTKHVQSILAGAMKRSSQLAAEPLHLSKGQESAKENRSIATPLFQMEHGPKEVPTTSVTSTIPKGSVSPLTLFDKPPSFSLPTVPLGGEMRPFSFGGEAKPLFGEKQVTFGAPPQNDPQAKPFTFGSTAPLQPSLFGIPPQSQFTFPPPVPVQDMGEEEGVDGNDMEDVSDAKRSPDNDPKLKTGEGEEGEECVVEERSKLFYWDSTAWKELGIGNAKINRHRDSGKHRFIFRAEGSGKALVNSWLKGIHAEAKGKEIFLSIPQQQPEGHAKIIKYLLRTRSIDSSAPIVATIKQAQQ